MSTQNKDSIELHKQHISSTNISKASEDARLLLFLRDEFFNTHESYLYNYTWSQLSSVEQKWLHNTFKFTEFWWNASRSRNCQYIIN